MKTIEGGLLPIKTWVETMDEGAMQQAENLSNLSFARHHIALMPDVHKGFGMPIGAVLATKDYIVPNAVGVDIGCGVIAGKTDLTNLKPSMIQRILDVAYVRIPVGFTHHKNPQAWDGFTKTPDIRILKQEMESAKHQLMTLGSGNHFISIEKGSDGHIWIMVHSGSRNFGNKVAKHYNKQAKAFNIKENIVPSYFDLAPLLMDSEIGKEYFAAMNYCMAFAKENRERMFDALFKILIEFAGAKEILEKYNIHHNYASFENHFSEDVIIHRKGTIRALKDEIVVVPGSMGTSSYIAKGLGNPMSFNSCAHGAGRAMSKRAANKTIHFEDAEASMKGVVHSHWEGDYSEAPAAYKDIHEVMAQQKDLIEPIVELNPLGVMKA